MVVRSAGRHLMRIRKWTDAATSARASGGQKQMSIQTTAQKDFGQHSVVQEYGIDEQGNGYDYYRCTECGREHINAFAFNDETTDAHKCEGGD